MKKRNSWPKTVKVKLSRLFKDNRGEIIDILENEKIK